MKRTHKIFFILVLAACFAVSSFAFAEDLDEPIIEIDIEEYSYAVTADSWRTVYTGTGVARNLTIENTTGLFFDIRMIDYSGNEVWYQYHTVGPWGVGYYYVGSNVQKVQMIGSDGIGFGVINVYIQ